MTAQDPRIEKLNYLAAALLAVAGIHVLLSLLSLPAALATGEGSAYAGVWRLLRIVFLVLGAVGGIVVAFFACYIINGRSFRKARLAAIGAAALPFLGPMGAVTIFALLPLGITAFLIFGKDGWRTAFSDVQADQGIATLDPASTGEEAAEQQETTLDPAS